MCCITRRVISSSADFPLWLASGEPNCLMWYDLVRVCAVFNGPSAEPSQHPHVWLGRPHAGWEAGSQLCGSRSDDVYVSVPLLGLNPCWHLALLFTSQAPLPISVRRPWSESSSWSPPAPALPGPPASKTMSLKPKKMCTSWTNELTIYIFGLELKAPRSAPWWASVRGGGQPGAKVCR